MSQTHLVGLAEEILSLQTDMQAIHVAALRITGMLDQMNAAASSAAAAIGALEAPLDRRASASRDVQHACLADQRAAIMRAQRLRFEAVDKLAKSARKHDALQAELARLRRQLRRALDSRRSECS